MKEIKKFSLVFGLTLILGWAHPCFGQLQDQPGLWATAGFEQDITEKFYGKVSQEIRFTEGFLGPGRTFTNFGLGYKVNRNIRLKLSYRLILNKSNSNYWGVRHRWMGDFLYRLPLNRYTLAYRMRLQRQHRGAMANNEFGNLPSWDLRHTFKVNYRLNRIYRPYFALDLRFMLEEPRLPTYSGFDRHRFTIGTDISLDDRRTLGVFVLQGRQWNVPEPTRVWVLGIEYFFGTRFTFPGS